MDETRHTPEERARRRTLRRRRISYAIAIVLTAVIGGVAYPVQRAAARARRT
jgi:hypothetical protein